MATYWVAPNTARYSSGVVPPPIAMKASAASRFRFASFFQYATDLGALGLLSGQRWSFDRRCRIAASSALVPPARKRGLVSAMSHPHGSARNGVVDAKRL